MKKVLQLLSIALLLAWLSGYFLMQLPPVFHGVLMLSAILFLRSIFVIQPIVDKTMDKSVLTET